MITGSNAKMLSGELATRLRGRYVSYRIRGLCYEEFLEFHGLPDDDASLGLYLQNGGLPQLRNLGLDNQELVEDYFDNVYNTIVLRDIIERENIRNVPLLRMLLKFVSDNIGKLFSAQSIVKFLKSQNTDTSAKVMGNAVYCHLSRMGYKVFVGQLQKGEIDFVAEKAGGTVYVQVTYLLASEEIVEREFGNLQLVKDSHPIL